jgi:hypothetical protein
LLFCIFCSLHFETTEDHEIIFCEDSWNLICFLFRSQCNFDPLLSFPIILTFSHFPRIY